jgi:hypothetical protein
MATEDPAIGQEDREAIIKLAEDLRTAPFEVYALQAVISLLKRLHDPESRDSLLGIFLEAGGLPSLIQHFCGTSPLSQRSRPDAMELTERAGKILTLLLRSKCDTKPLTEVAADIIPRLVEILRAGTLRDRCTAAELLEQVSRDYLTAASMMAEAGVVKLLLPLYIKVQDEPQAEIESAPAAGLAFRLATSDEGASSQLVTAFQARDTPQAFAAMTMLQVCLVVTCIATLISKTLAAFCVSCSVILTHSGVDGFWAH